MSSGERNPTNKALEALVEKAGVAKHVLEDTERVVCDDVWTEERARLARELLSKDTSTIPEFWQSASKHEPSSVSLSCFCQRNLTQLLIHRLHVVPPQKQPLYDEARVAASVCDITKDALPADALANGGVDFALCLFCLSALHPDTMKGAVKKVVAAIKPGGKLFFRDYGRYDQAQLRFRSGHKLQENFYVRQDNTRAYYFTTEEVQEIFTEAGLVPVENEYIRRQYANRQQSVVRFRVWIHAIFEKPALDSGVAVTDAA
ncbi:hypothetical protein BBJ28_00013769 [Nothophytophthora sp. Chile5]|nr:hypothetical protein BBJ28_00013769 [Nothophytophthora sp. Chile5]